jgi:glutaredoxin
MRILLYTRSDCFYCDHIKKILDSQNMEYHEIDLDKNDVIEEVKRMCEENNVANRQLPIFIAEKDGHKLIGSYLELLDFVFPPLEIKD